MGKSIFDSQQVGDAYPEGIEKNYWTQARSWILKRHLRSCGLSQRRILDIGTGVGREVSYMRRHGFDCWGVEPALTSPEAEVKDFVFTGKTAEMLPHEFRNTVKAVTLLDVLEHVERPTRMVADIIESFPTVELFIVTLPARNELFSNYDEYYGHARRFSLEEAAALFEGTRTTIENARYFFHALYPPARLMLKLGMKRKVSLRPPSPFTSWLHSLAGRLLQLDDMLLPGRLYGTSVLLTARVNARG